MIYTTKRINGNIAAAYFEPAAIKASEAMLVAPQLRVCITDPAKSSSMSVMSLENLRRRLEVFLDSH
jgi:hypothetical protein